MPLIAFIILSALVLWPSSSHAESYRDSDIPGWQQIVFDGLTRYTQTPECVLAEASDSASGLIQEVREPLAADSRLTWSWRAESLPSYAGSAMEKSKSGDDFLARVYVIHEGFFFWQTKAINYVWSMQHEQGSHWPNPFTGNAVMVAVQSGDEGLGQWHEFSRDVQADFARFHDMKVDAVDAIAVMTDADNTDGSASACYRLPSLSTSR